MKKPLFSRKHYVEIAKCFHASHTPFSTIAAFARMFSEDNPNFDVMKFLEAVEMEGKGDIIERKK